MNKGRCLCGSVRWELLAEPSVTYNCHCRMCQKIHGTAFGTYCFFKLDQFLWINALDTVAHYESSKYLIRSSCNVCGSVVPYLNKKKDYWLVPAGCHNKMRKPDYNIFVIANSPWHIINEDIPGHDAYPVYLALPSVENLPVIKKAEGFIRGSCLCGEISYQITEPLITAHNCHCSRCRNGRSAAHASNGFVSYDGVKFLSGEDKLKSYKVTDARHFTQVFCNKCSSLMPRHDFKRGITVVPLGSLDDCPEIKPVDHIFVKFKAEWHTITDNLPQFAEGPPNILKK